MEPTKLTLRQRRRLADMSMDELAEKAGVHRHSILRWEHDGIGSMSVDNLKKVAAALGCEPADLID